MPAVSRRQGPTQHEPHAPQTSAFRGHFVLKRTAHRLLGAGAVLVAGGALAAVPGGGRVVPSMFPRPASWSGRVLVPSPPPPVPPPPIYPTSPSVWGVLRDPAAYAGPLITLTGFVIDRFEYAELLQTRQELEVRMWQFEHRAGPRRSRILGLWLPVDLTAPEVDYDGLEVRLTGRVIPRITDKNNQPVWEEGAEFRAESVEFVR